MSSQYQLPKLHQFTSHNARRQWLENHHSISLSNTAHAFADSNNLDAVHCENLIGGTSIPTGVAGPLIVSLSGQDVDTPSPYFVPLATSEGALVASVSRGMKAIADSGGAITYVQKIGTTRAPVFHTSSLQDAMQLSGWLTTHISELSAIAATTSSHLQLLKLDPVVEGRRVFARFFFDTDAAMGMNMVTIASQKMVNLIEEETGAVCTAVSGNYCVDKKASWLNFTTGRGYKAWAEVRLSADTILGTLKSTPDALCATWSDKCMHGSVLAGSLGFNCHFANVVAAFYLATGQDAGHIVEGSMGVLSVEPDADGVIISVYMPSVMLGTVGGGTKLSTQTEALAMIGVSSPQELAQVLAGTVLAGEISLLASLSVGSLAGAHSRLGR